MSRRVGVMLVLAGAAAVTAQTPVPAPPPRGSVLAGQVVEAGSTTPVAGAMVTLGGTPSLNASPVVFSFVQAPIAGGPRAVLTSAQGHFAFFDVPDGVYSIQATKPGYIPGGYGKRRADGAPQPLRVSGTGGLAGLAIPLMRYATISGTVIDEAGEPVVGARLRAMRRTYENGRMQYHVAASGMQADTDDRGMYRFTTLIPGDYLICVPATQTTTPLSVVEAFRKSREGQAAAGVPLDLAMSVGLISGSSGSGLQIRDQFFLPTLFGGRAVTPPPPGDDGPLAVYPMLFYPSATAPSQATAITVAAGEDRTGVDLQLRPVAAPHVSGTLVGPAGPASGVELSLVHATSPLISDTFFAVAASTTDSRGAFTFLGVPPGQYVLRTVILPPRQPQPPSAPSAMVQTPTGAASLSETQTITPQVPEGPTLWTAMPVSVADTPVTGLTVTLQRGVRVRGRLEFDGTAPTPADATRRIAVTIERLDPPPMDAVGLPRATVDSSGAFASYELPTGRYVIQLRGSIPGWTFAGAMRGSVDLSDVPFELSADLDDVVIRFTDRPSLLRGTVRTPAGEADASAQVLVFPAAAASAERTDSTRRLRATRVGADGAYNINGLPAGEYLVVAVPDETAAAFPSAALLKSLLPRAMRVTVPANGTVTRDLSIR